MQNRDKIFTLFTQYQQSYSEENKFLGDERILNQIKQEYAFLSSDDQQYVQARCKAMCKEANTLKPHLMKGAAGGAVGGAIIGGVTSLFSSRFPFFSTCFTGAITGSIVGGYGYTEAHARSLGETIPSLTRKMRPYARFQEAVGITNDILTDLRQYQAVASEGTVRQRNNRGRG